MSQKLRVLQLLREQGRVCVTTVPMDLAYTLRNRVAELRADGIEIIGERCRDHWHRGPILSYRLVVKPVQQALALRV